MAADPKEQAKTQLQNIEKHSGLKVADFAAAIEAAGIEKHGQVVTFLKSTYGLSHGNANLLAHTVREMLAGGPLAEEELLATQYRGAKASLRPIYDELAAIAQSLGDDVTMVVQKTGVSFRRKKQFALVQAPSSKRIQLSLNLAVTPDDDRIVEMKGMCTHRVDIKEAEIIDDEIASWIRSAYDEAG